MPVGQDRLREWRSVRRFRAGQEFRTSDGTQYRILPGRKGPNDLVLQRRRPGWTIVRMESLFLEFDFLYENEDWLYGSGAQGGEKLREALEIAVAWSWDAARLSLDAEKRARRRVEP